MPNIDENTFCDDCGSPTHTWENCPLTRDMTYDHSDVGIFDGYGDYDDEPADIDDQGDVNPYDYTREGMYEDDYIYDDWQSESDLWGEM
jgi:hypothetical protein